MGAVSAAGNGFKDVETGLVLGAGVRGQGGGDLGACGEEGEGVEVAGPPKRGPEWGRTLLGC